MKKTHELDPIIEKVMKDSLLLHKLCDLIYELLTHEIQIQAERTPHPWR